MTSYKYEKQTKKRVPAKRVDIVSIRQRKLEICKENSILYENRKISSPGNAAELLNHFLLDNDREQMVVISLNTKNEPINMSLVSIGSLNTAICHPREIFKISVKANANAIIIGHSHISGQIEPSDEDKQVTERLVKSGKVLGVPLLDHLIIGDENRYFSFKEEGLL